MKSRVKEWFYTSMKMVPGILMAVAVIRFMVILDQKVSVNTKGIATIVSTKKEWDTKYYNILKRLGVIENGMSGYVTVPYFRYDNKIVKSDIMWSHNRIYILQGKVAMNTGEIKGAHLNG